MKILKFFEYVYLLIGAISLYTAYAHWNTNRGKAQMFLIFAALSVFMYFFRRYFRKKFEKRRSNNS